MRLRSVLPSAPDAPPADDDGRRSKGETEGAQQDYRRVPNGAAAREELEVEAVQPVVEPTLDAGRRRVAQDDGARTPIDVEPGPLRVVELDAIDRQGAIAVVPRVVVVVVFGHEIGRDDRRARYQRRRRSLDPSANLSRRIRVMHAFDDDCAIVGCAAYHCVSEPADTAPLDLLDGATARQRFGVDR